MSPSSPSYWIVGSAEEGRHDHYDEFVEKGYWTIFWTREKDPVQYERSAQIRRNDFIALKKNNGGRSGMITVRAVGVVESVRRSAIRVGVRWVFKNLDQVVSGTNWFGTVYGPLSLDKQVVQQVFNPIIQSTTKDVPSNPLAEDIKEILANSKTSETTRQALIDARVGQGTFRTDVLKLWDGCCAVTGSCSLEAIRASHITPWHNSTNGERLDPQNGLPLVANLDALFDAGLITFEDDGRIQVSPALPTAEFSHLGVSPNAKLSKKPAARTAKYLKRHRTSVFRRQ